MDAKRALLSCPGRVQDWLGAAAGQIENLLLVPLPSLSGSDQAIGALRIKRECRPSRTTGPYSLRPTKVAPGTSPVIHLSASFSGSPPAEKSLSRCENCVAEKRSRCSRDLPSCTRCLRSGMFCFYMEGPPTGRRKPQQRRHRQRRVGKGGTGLPAQSSPDVTVSILEDPTLGETDELLDTQHQQLSFPGSSEYTQSSVERWSNVYPTDFPMDLVTPKTNQSFVVKRPTTALRATSTFGTLPRKVNPETPELSSVVFSEFQQPSLARESTIVSAEIHISQDPGWGEKQQAVQSILQMCNDRNQGGSAHLAVLPLHSQPHRQISAVSSLATTPFASTLGSRSTSRSSWTDSLPITPATELPMPLGRTCGTTSSMDTRNKSFPEEFLAELFEEGDAAKKLIESQRGFPFK